MANTATMWLPGASDKIGFGLNIFGDFVRPTLKDKFLDLTPDGLLDSQWHDQEITLVPTKYKLPNKVLYSPIPVSEARYIVADSKMKLTETLSTSVEATATFGAFTGTLKASYSDWNETTEDRWYCLTDGSQTVYELHASNLDLTLLHPQVRNNDIYTNLIAVLDKSDGYNDADQEAYFTFFNWFGTHIITGVTMGGGLHIFTSVEKKYVKREQEVKTSLGAEYTAVFKGTATADWKRVNQSWAEHREGSLVLYGGNPGPLSSKVGAGKTLPETDLSSDYEKWGESVKTNPMMVRFQVIKIGDVFDTSKRKMLVNEAYERYARSYIHLTFANRENKLEWRKKPVEPLPVSPFHHDPQKGKPYNIHNPDRFQGWCVIDRTSAQVVKVIPFAENTASQAVPAELKDRSQYNNENFIVLFSHWEGVVVGQSTWTEQPFTSEMASFLRNCGGGPVLESYNRVMPRNVDPYNNGFYVLCGVIGSGAGKGKEFTNIFDDFQGIPLALKEIIVPLIPSRTGAGFRLSLLD